MNCNNIDCIDCKSQDGYTLNTILVCLLDSDHYPVNVDSTVEFLIRQAFIYC